MKVLLLLISCMTFLSMRSEEYATAEMHILDDHHETHADEIIEEGDASMQDGEALANVDSDESVMNDLLEQDTTDLDTQHFEEGDDSEEKAWYSSLDAKQILKDIEHFIDLHDDQDSALLDLQNPSFSDIEAALHAIHQKLLYNKIIYNDTAASADLQKADEYEGALENIKKFTPDALVLLHQESAQKKNTISDHDHQNHDTEETHPVTYNQPEEESEVDQQEEPIEEDTEPQDQEYESSEEEAEQSEEEPADEETYESEEAPEEEQQEEYETEEEE